MLVNIDLQVASSVADSPDETQICEWVTATLELAGIAGTAKAELAVRLVDEAESKELNGRFRNIDKPTNVLSFPFEQLDGMPASGPLQLGDLAICSSVVMREARDQGKQPMDHWAHMLVHGTLHLQGYDHETDDQASEMEALEARILHQFGISNPYLASS